MLIRADRWNLGEPDTLVYVAAVSIGVPLTMWELWHAGRATLVYALAALWGPTVVLMAFDMVRGQVSKLSTVCFFAWVIVVLGYGIYALVV